MTPLLVLGYNRPELLLQLLNSIKSNPPEVLLIALDGPIASDVSDLIKVSKCIEHIESQQWAPEVITKFRSEHLGLRSAVTDAITWAMNLYGRAIIVEDDIIIGPQFLEYMTFMLNKHEGDSTIAQVNGYNEVPPEILTPLTSASRMSKYPTSCAWGTWKSRWEKYDDDLKWGNEVSLADLANQVGSRFGAIKWKINFSDAAKFRVDSWAIRWVSTIWSHDLYTIYPNRNLVFHDGRKGGTHTRTQPKWDELAISSLENALWEKKPLSVEESSKSCYWLQRNVFSETVSGIIRGFIFSKILQLRNLSKRKCRLY